MRAFRVRCECLRIALGSCLAVILIGAAATSSGANSTNAAGYVKRFEARYKNAKTLQATFLETYTEGGAVARIESGTVYFKRPGKMRWEYRAPEQNLYLVDGKNAWFYVPADRTVTRAPAKESGDFRTPLALLAGEMKVSRICDRVEISNTETAASPSNVMLSCIFMGTERQPGPDSPAKNGLPEDAAFFEVNRSTGELARIRVRQAGAIQVEFKFKDWQFDPRLPEVMFHFAAPKGVAIVNGNAME